MSNLEAAFCRSAPWRLAARKVVLPWTLMKEDLSGSVLELGSGSGAMAAEILRRFPKLTLTASDLDPSMLSQARETLKPFGARALVREADATSLQFADREFDAVVSFVMLHHVGAWETALAEAVRVLRPGGLLLVADFVDFPGLQTVERATGNPGVRPIEWLSLEPELRTLPLEDVRARRSARAVFRLRASKA